MPSLEPRPVCVHRCVFTDALNSLGVNPKKFTDEGPRALYALQRLRTLYSIERRGRDESAEQRRQVRQAESVLVLDALRACLDDTLKNVPPSSLQGKTISARKANPGGVAPSPGSGCAYPATWGTFRAAEA